MTQPDPLDLIRASISALERTVNGDSNMGVKPIRAVAEDLQKAVTLIQQERAQESAERRGQQKTLTWIFGTSAGSVIATIILLIKQFGGGS